MPTEIDLGAVSRTVDEIINGDALTWCTMGTEQLRNEHERLRLALITAREQIALWSPLVAWRHQVESERDDALTKMEAWRNDARRASEHAGELMRKLDEVEREKALETLKLAEIAELFGPGGDNTAFGRAESALADLTHRLQALEQACREWAVLAPEDPNRRDPRAIAERKIKAVIKSPGKGRAP